MKRKVIRITIVMWLLVVAVCGYVYVVTGAGWPPIAAEYETRWDYRLVFFAASCFPVLTLTLALVLLIERWLLPEES
jgi:hypothetical protein